MSMIIVTGGAGFIGSNLVKALNQRGECNILVVDDLKDGRKFKNIVDCDIYDYIDQDDFLENILNNYYSSQKISAIFHQGACSSTTEWDGKYMMRNNYDYSKVLLEYCTRNKIPFIYASSAAAYGNGKIFQEKKEYEAPLNVYGYSKFLFDQFARRVLPNARSQIVGLRYFNVYGPREFHKGNMSSVAFHFYNQIRDNGVCKLFKGTDGYKDGEQLRDFIFVADAVEVILWFYDHKEQSGIFNLGTGRAQSFNDVANAVINWFGSGKIKYIPFPDNLRKCYQSFTQADISKLRLIGCNIDFKTVEQGVSTYLDYLAQA